jgi:hypothetical protein
MEIGLVLAGGLVVVIGLAAVSVFAGTRVRGGEARQDPDFARETEGFGEAVPDFSDAAGSAEGLRSAARAAYETGWDKATAGGKALGKCHETALINVLYERWRVEPSAPRADQATFQAFMLESLPFNVLPIHQGRTAMVEYVVWREFPEDADAGLVGPAVRQAVRRLQTDTTSDVAARLKSTPMPWTEFIA